MYDLICCVIVLINLVSPQFRCACDRGYQAADCSQRICPFSRAWSDHASATDIAHNSAECSNRGHCDRETGHCSCMDGFTGAACERLSCANDCSHRGVCMSMQTLAQKSRDEFSNRYLYTERWDADKIQGCKCDFPATGYDCSRTLCPTGDDPLTLNQNNEVQIVQCIANTGSFVLFYNGVASANIAYDATALSVSQSLQKIPALKNGVKVSFSIPNSRVCQLQRNNVLIEFTQQFGKQNPLVPQLSADMSSSGGQVNVRYGGVGKFLYVLLWHLQVMNGEKIN